MGVYGLYTHCLLCACRFDTGMWTVYGLYVAVYACVWTVYALYIDCMPLRHWYVDGIWTVCGCIWDVCAVYRSVRVYINRVRTVYRLHAAPGLVCGLYRFCMDSTWVLYGGCV